MLQNQVAKIVHFQAKLEISNHTLPFTQNVTLLMTPILS